MIPDKTFWPQQRVLLTGHTGFKGTWLALWLERLGASCVGLALDPETDPSLFGLTKPHPCLVSCIGDVRNPAAVAAAVALARPTIAIHMAAQPIVRRSYREPIETVATNVMGVANLLQALRDADELRAALVVTTDKVYRNSGTEQPFGEDCRLGGHDPYSASKAAAEIITSGFADSFFGDGPAVATARAGNVVGGGDWADDRLIPDVWRSAAAKTPVTLRNPDALRPWQHVLDVLCGYLAYAEALASRPGVTPRTLNFGPGLGDAQTVAAVTEAVCEGLGLEPSWNLAPGPHPKEAQFLSLDASLAWNALGWRPRLSGGDTIRWTVEWYRAFDMGTDPRALCMDQISRYEGLS